MNRRKTEPSRIDSPRSQIHSGCAGVGILYDRQARVFMLDLLPTVPYYTGNLCAALQHRPEVKLVLGAATYTHDSTYFARTRVPRRQFLLDVASRVPDSAKLFRRSFKLIEYLFNLTMLSLQFVFSRPDVVHVQFTPLVGQGLPFELWFLRWLRALGCRIVYTVHNVLPHENGERYRSLYARVYRLADHLICHDVHASTVLTAKFQLPANKITVIPHGPLLAPSQRCSQREARMKLGLPQNSCIVLWQGIIRRYKGVSFLLKAWKEARDKGLDATLAIVGTGDKQILDEVTEEVQKLQISSSVHLDLRFVPVETLESYLSAADILVYPYSSITTSGALMTGMNYGKAVIASTLPAFQGLLEHEKNALLVPYSELDNWASALGRLASSPDLRARLSSSLRSSGAAQLDWNEIGSETLHVYQQVLAQSHSPVTALKEATPAPHR